MSEIKLQATSNFSVEGRGFAIGEVVEGISEKAQREILTIGRAIPITNKEAIEIRKASEPVKKATEKGKK